MYIFFKKILFSIIIFILVFTPIFSFKNKAYAQFGIDLGDVGDSALACGTGYLSSLITRSITSVVSDPLSLTKVPTSDSAQIARQESLIAKEYVLDCLVREAAQVVSEQVIQSTINWVNRGLSGQPYYIQNLGNHYAGLVNGIAQQYIFDLSTELQNDEYTPYVVESLAKNQSNPTLAEKLACPEGNKMSDVFKGGESDSWFAFMRAASIPGCTAGGRVIAAQSDLQNKQAEALDRQEQQLAWSNGIISERDENGNVTTPGAVIGNLLEKSLTTGYDNLVAADEIAELFSSLVNQSFTIMSSGGSLFES